MAFSCNFGSEFAFKKASLIGRVAEWLGRGLQNLVRRFESVPDLSYVKDLLQYGVGLLFLWSWCSWRKSSPRKGLSASELSLVADDADGHDHGENVKIHRFQYPSQYPHFHF